MMKLLISSALIIVTMILFSAVDGQIARLKRNEESAGKGLGLKGSLALTTIAALVCLAALAFIVMEHRR
jgi:hypothetical protein